MQIYLVGGAVRDKQLDYPVIDHDWVVVGATPSQMLEQGYKQVGKDFPVFLHPENGDEYALARTERKSGSGHHGFAIDASNKVTLEDDLIRRDLTINAMALSEQGELIDPYGGANDLANRLLKHVSPAFIEDPLRVLRVARFAARYHHLGFRVAPETLQLMTELSASEELKQLSAERVWQETQKALTEKSPHIFFETLRQCGGLNYWFPELGCLWGIPNPAKWHPEIDSGVHTMMVLEQAAILTDDPVTRFASVCHDLGKGVTPKELWPSHHGHEKLGIKVIAKLCKRLKVPVQYTRLAKMVSEFHLHLHKIEELNPRTVVKVLEKTDAFRKSNRFEKFLIACEADFRGRTGFEKRDYPQSQRMRDSLAACQSISVQGILDEGYTGAQISEQIHRQRVSRVKHMDD
jgi:tRNA nucleotidyltransferase (CCA-adding enzyme)